MRLPILSATALMLASCAPTGEALTAPPPGPVTVKSETGANAVERGHRLVQTNCATCHAVERTGSSPYKPAPPFRTLVTYYDVDGLDEAFAEGIVVGHKGVQKMPEFQLTPDQIGDLIAYLHSLETK